MPFTQQQQICPFFINAADQYSISFTTASCRQFIGAVPSAMFAKQSGAKFTAVDRDNDLLSDSNCAQTFGKVPFWFTDCWQGCIWGGGEMSDGGYLNGAYWLGGEPYWGLDAGRGAGNGWIFVK